MSHTYQCSMCGVTFDSGWSHEEAVAEKEADFPGVPMADCDVVCDDCYQQVRPANNPREYLEYLDAQAVESYILERLRILFPKPPTIRETIAKWWTACDYWPRKTFRNLNN